MNKATLKRTLAVILATLFALAFAGCGEQNGSAEDDSLQKVLDAGQLILGLDVAFPPMGFIDDGGEIVGFDIDVAQEVCNRLGITLVKQSIDWDEKENDLNEGRIDCIWNGFSITPARDEAMCLSDPYMKNELIVVVLGDSEAKGLRDLKGLKVGVQSGSTAQDVLKASEIFPDVTEVPYDTVTVMIDKLNAREIDAAVVDSVSAYYFIFSNEDQQYFTLPDSLGEEEYAIGFRKNDRKLRDKIQEIISEMKADGTLGEISKKWFGSDITTVK